MSGIEPEAFRMRNGRSTTELHPPLHSVPKIKIVIFRTNFLSSSKTVWGSKLSSLHIILQYYLAQGEVQGGGLLSLPSTIIHNCNKKEISSRTLKIGNKTFTRSVSLAPFSGTWRESTRMPRFRQNCRASAHVRSSPSSLDILHSDSAYFSSI
jgi:hypothetical protein